MTGADTPPQPQWDHDIERVIIGAALNNPKTVSDIENTLAPDALHDPRNATIWHTIRHHWYDGHDTGPVAIAHTLIRTGELKRLPGGTTYILECCEAATVGDIGWYVREANRYATIRRLHEATTRAHQTTANPNGHRADELADRITTIISQATNTITPDKPTLATAATVVETAIAKIGDAAEGKDTVIPTGFHDLDRLLNGGFRPGQFIIIAGRPGMGKTVAATNIIINAAKRGIHGLYSTLEMSNDELMLRILADQCRIPHGAITAGRLDDNQWAHLARRSVDIAELPLHLDERAEVTIPRIAATIAQLNRTQRLGIAVVDYLQLITPVTGGRPAENRQVEVSALSRGCKLLAKDAGLPLVMVAQLNRGPASRTDKRPELTDLRESGSLEQDADVVIFVHRDEYYDPDTPRKGEADLIVAKNRGGQTGTITVAAQLHYSRFADMAAE